MSSGWVTECLLIWDRRCRAKSIVAVTVELMVTVGDKVRVLSGRLRRVSRRSNRKSTSKLLRVHPLANSSLVGAVNWVPPQI